MAMDGAVPAIIIALGAGALGGPDALRLLMELARRNPAIDIGIIVFLISMFAVQLLGTLRLARYVRKAPPAEGTGAERGAPRAPAADYFARITLVLSLAAASLVTACLVLVSGGPISLRPLVDFAAEYCFPVVIAAAAAARVALYAAHLLGAFRLQRDARGGADHAERATTTRHGGRFIGARLAAAAGAGAALPCIAPLLRAFREQRNARGSAERAATTRHAARSICLPLAAAVCALVVGAPSGARGSLDALCHSPGFTNMAVAVAVAVGAALLLVVRFYSRARNAAAAAGCGVAAPELAAASAR
ncbi:unnamed protein product [Urochloa decumbens]|uniref:Uncharacterized protein n=1 Tax=Urochloa decumbens TaxID=240449 RepID=A0ABC9E871_9POAL